VGSFAVVAFVLLLGVAYLVARAYLTPDQTALDEDEIRSPLEVKKEQLLDAIRELDMDYETGKLSEDDYMSLRARFVAETAEVMRSLVEVSIEPAAAITPDPGASSASDSAELPGSVVSVLTRGSLEDPIGEDDLEREIATRKAKLAVPPCPGCGAELSVDDAFCRACGARLAPPGDM